MTLKKQQFCFFNSKTMFQFYGVMAIFVAVYHFLGIVIKVDNSPAWRHFTFVLINLFCFYGFQKRPYYFKYFFLLLTFQQYFSHGSRLMRWWANGQIDWLSIGVLLFMPLICWHLFRSTTE